MRYNANKPFIIKSHRLISRVEDGDGLYVKNIEDGEEEQVRLSGIDAPEMKKCRKLLQDERETHLPGAFLMKLGIKSLLHLSEIAPLGSPCTLIIENKREKDAYGRTLAYVMLQDLSILNEQMIRDGFAKPYTKAFCQALPFYQVLNSFAKRGKIGLYQYTNVF